MEFPEGSTVKYGIANGLIGQKFSNSSTIRTGLDHIFSELSTFIGVNFSYGGE